MRCDDYECLISAFADGELDKKAADELQNHLAHCEHCRRVYAETWALQHQLSVVFLGPSETPDMEAAVLSRIFPSRRRATFRWAWAAAAAVVLALVCAKTFVPSSHPEKQVLYVSEPSIKTPVPALTVESKITPDKNATDNVVVKTPKKDRTYYVPLIHKPKRHEKEEQLIAAIKPAAIAVESAVVTVEYEDNTPVVTEGFRPANIPEIPRFNPDIKPGGGRVSTVCAFASDPKDRKIRALCYIRVNEHGEDPL